LRVLVVNAGSTSLKLHVVDGERSEPIDSLGRPSAVDAVAHRVVHGGPRFREPVVIDDEVLDAIAGLRSLAPLHNAPALRGIEAARAALPDVPHVAVFDTAFHGTIPDEASTYALPARWRDDWGIRRYGFHGLSVQWSAERAAALLGGDRRLVVAHLGGGCSVTAVRGGRSVDTTMGFSPLEGVPMTTRSGSLDPGAVLYVLRERGVSLDDVDLALNEESGVKGLAGLDSMRSVEEAAAMGDVAAELALSVFGHRVAGAVGAMAVAAEGLDALVFTAGIGENSAAVRADVCSRLSSLGVSLDVAANAAPGDDRDISVADSAARVLVIHAREELVAARAADRTLTKP
jgi:acetate kinase